MSNPLLIFRQDRNFRLHLDVIKCWIVMASQVVSVIVVVDWFVMFWLSAKFLHERFVIENFTFMWNCLDVIFILVGWFEKCALLTNYRELIESLRLKGHFLPETSDLDSLESPQDGRTTWRARPYRRWLFPTSTQCDRCRDDLAGLLIGTLHCHRPGEDSTTLLDSSFMGSVKNDVSFEIFENKFKFRDLTIFFCLNLEKQLNSRNSTFEISKSVENQEFHRFKVFKKR